jgi:1-acyl-sn-glycerol-3-phosphate acyltransferase
MKKMGIPQSDPAKKFKRKLFKALLALFHWRIEGAVPDVPKCVIVGAPHTSNWDFVLTIVTAAALDLKIAWMGKHTLFRAPFGRLFRWLGGIPIDRRDAGGVVAQNVAEFSRRDKLLLCITPEGTRSKVREWRTGFYHIAVGAQVPIMLVAFDYGRKVVAVGRMFMPSGDLAADLAEIQAYYRTITPRHPQHF